MAPSTHASPLMDILLKTQLFSSEDIEMLITRQQENGGNFLLKCLEASGLSEDVLLPKLAEALSVPMVEPATLQPSAEILKLLPAKVVYQLKVIPMQIESNGILRVMTHDPFRFGMLETLQLCSGYRIRLALSPLAEVEKMIKKLYGVGGETIEQLLETSLDDSDGADLLDADPEELDEEASVVKFVNQIIWEARQEGATDIHMEPMEKDLRIRYRIDGVLVPVALPARLKRFQAAILSRLKVMANMDIAEKRLPQDGRIGLRIRGEDVDIRVSTMPTVYGESISLRLLMRNTTLMGMEKLGLCEQDSKKLSKLISRPHGILLVTGPTGSGKSTSLYTYLNSINSTDKRIVTCEDPIEYEIPGINQIQMKPEIGLNFAKSLRHILRQDPDVIMIGEIRDFDTSEIAVQAALTGHLVFSTLHTNDAASGFTRLLDMGVEPFLVASSLEALVAQRLVRTLCPECKKPADYSEDYLKEMGVKSSEMASQDTDGKPVLFQAEGCEACRQTGYRGRTGIYEILTVTDEIRQMVIAREPAGRIKQQAMKQGMTPLREDGWKKVIAGQTTLEEVIRVTEEDAEE